MKRHDEEDTCVALKEGVCSVWKELERAVERIGELEEEGGIRSDTGVSIFRDCIARARRLWRKKHPGSHYLADGAESIVEAVERAEEAETERSVLQQEHDEAERQVQEGRRVFQGFINDCARLLGLPELDENAEYGGGAIRRGIMRLREAHEDVNKMILEQAEQIKSSDVTVKRLRGALERVNDIRNDIIARQSVNWSAHIYPLVAALDNAGLKGMEYTEAREKIEATMGDAQRLVAQAWCSETTEQTEMDPVLAEEFAEVLFPFLKTVEFYARGGNWQGMKDGFEESACERDLGARARLVMGLPDREVPEDGSGSCRPGYARA